MQVAELRDDAARRDWEVVREVVEDGVSGAADRRPGLESILADSAAGKIDVVAVWRLGRFGRSLSHLLTTLDTLAAQGVGFVSLRDPGIDTTTPTGRLLLQLLGAFAEFERALYPGARDRRRSSGSGGGEVSTSASRRLRSSRVLGRPLGTTSGRHAARGASTP